MNLTRKISQASLAAALSIAFAAVAAAPSRGTGPGPQPAGGHRASGGHHAPGAPVRPGYGGHYGHRGHYGYSHPHWGWGLGVAVGVPWALGLYDPYWPGSAFYPYYPSYAYRGVYPAYPYGYGCGLDEDCWRAQQAPAEPAPATTVVPPLAAGAEGGPTERPLHLNYCDSARGWFPHVRTCPGGWRMIRPEYIPAR